MKWALLWTMVAAQTLMVEQASLTAPARALAQTVQLSGPEAESLCLIAAIKQLPAVSGTTLKATDIAPNTIRSSPGFKFYDVRVVVDLAGRSAWQKYTCAISPDGAVKLL